MVRMAIKSVRKHLAGAIWPLQMCVVVHLIMHMQIAGGSGMTHAQSRGSFVLRGGGVRTRQIRCGLRPAQLSALERQIRGVFFAGEQWKKPAPSKTLQWPSNQGMIKVIVGASDGQFSQG